MCCGRGGVRNRKDAHFSWKRLHTCQRTAVHLSCDGAASACREMVQRGDLDASGRQSVRHRRMPERSGIEWIHGRE